MTCSLNLSSKGKPDLETGEGVHREEEVVEGEEMLGGFGWGYYSAISSS